MEELKEEPPGSWQKTRDQQSNDSTNEMSRKQQLKSVKTAIFVVATATIVLIAFRNTVTWYCFFFFAARCLAFVNCFIEAVDFLCCPSFCLHSFTWLNY